MPVHSVFPAAARARLLQGDRPLLLKTEAAAPAAATERSKLAQAVLAGPERATPPRQAEAPPPHKARERRPETDDAPDEVEKETFRIEVGHVHGVKPGNIVGAIANEAGIDSSYIGRIDIREDHSFIDLPTGMPKKIFKDLQKVWVSGQQLRISRKDQAGTPYGAPPKHGKPRHRPRG